jgi:hypothetical protein
VFSTLARALLLGIALAMACVIPIPAEVENEDAGTSNAPPVIVSSTPEMPGPITLPQTMSVTLKDIDIADTLYVRVFRDYADDPRPVFTIPVVNDAQIGTEIRTRELDAAAICAGAMPNEDLVIDVMVADRPYDDENPSAPPANRRVTGNGQSSMRSWIARCAP